MVRSLMGLLQRMKNALLTEVPAEMAACEFECRETECSTQDWETCTKRLQKAEAITQGVDQ